MGIAANVARAPGAGADIVQRFFHRSDDSWMLAHPEIVVRAPDGDRLWPIVARKALCVGKLTLGAQDIDEHTIPALFVKAANRGFEYTVVIHGYSWTIFAPGGLYLPAKMKAIANDSQL
jgi:hypothetical protein